LGLFCLESEVLELADGAIERMRNRLSRFAPGLAKEADIWTRELSRTGKARDYFNGGRSILLLLPRFLREVCQRAPDRAFESDLAYSTINAYYFVRLIDDVVDGSPAARPHLLPLLGFLHAEFQSTYARYFQPDNAFWERFHFTWVKMADSIAEQARLSSLTSNDFLRISAGKSSGIRIPLAAVCEFYSRPDLLESWCVFFDAFAIWSQMLDDMLDWVRDYSQASTTWFLSEARRRKRRDEPVSAWILREGIEWGFAHAASQLRALRDIAAELKNENLIRYLDYREAQVAQLWEALHPQLPALARLALVLEG
jgi:hypothetical protein